MECSKCLFGGKPGEDGCLLDHGAPGGRRARKKWLSKKKPVRVALVGNANVGKSAIFNQMTGLDLTALHLRLARRAAKEAGVEVRWQRADMRDIP